MRQHRYRVSWVRGNERRTFNVFAWNQDDAYVEGCKAMREAGEDTKGWWFYGAERC